MTFSKPSQVTYPCTISVIFSALAAETYINFYAAEKMSSNFFKTYLDKLEVPAKWIVVPQLIHGKSIDTGCSAMKKLGELITLRNKLVHSKSTHVKVVTDGLEGTHLEGTLPPSATLQDAKNGIEAVKELMIYLHAADSNVKLNWINDYD